eukprot:PhM_4_TR11883/c0_g1_i1/m.43233
MSVPASPITPNDDSLLGTNNSNGIAGTFEVFVPGRVCLLGEHSDWAGGFRRFNSEIVPGNCVVYGTDTGIHARVRRHPNKLIIRAISETGVAKEATYPMEVGVLRQEAAAGGFFSYALGVASVVAMNHDVQGLEIDNYLTTLPMAKGLSSSAAVCVLVARAFNRAYDLRLTTRGEMELAYQGEIVTPSRCGRMDQCCAFGKTCVLMTFDGDFVETTVVDPPKPLYFVVADLQRKKDTKIILGSLTRAYPFKKPDNKIDDRVHEFLGATNRRIVQNSLDAIRVGDAERLGALMSEAQRHFDECLIPACPEELTAPRLHEVMDAPEFAPLIYGRKGVGSQGDGCVQFLCRDAEAQEKVWSMLGSAEFGCVPFKFTLGERKQVRHCVIPVAGAQPLMFPANLVCGTCLFPVVDPHDKIAKPVIMMLIEEALACGIERVVLVVRPEDEVLFQRLFNPPVHSETTTPHLYKYAAYLKEAAKRVDLIVQKECKGFGDAVLCAKKHLEGNPFVVLLGDHIYRTPVGCVDSALQQILSRFNGTRGVLGLGRSSPAEVTQVGAVSGSWAQPYELMNVNVVVEKPSMESAESSLVRDDAGKYFTVFGNYVLPSTFLDMLESDPTHNFAGALDALRKAVGLDGVVMNATRVDFHTPELYQALKI